MGEPSGVCPHCGGPSEYQNVRYPRALCHACDLRTTDLAQRAVRLENESMSGGFIALHRDDGSRCEQVTGNGRVLIDGIEYGAAAHGRSPAPALREFQRSVRRDHAGGPRNALLVAQAGRAARVEISPSLGRRASVRGAA